jgi:hypothetical protein
MNNVVLKRDYKSYVTIAIPDVVVWEFECSLDTTTDSSMGYLLVEPWTDNEETIFYHRSSWDTVWFYQINRSWSIAHDDNAQVLLVNSIDYMNYILWQTNEQLFLYKKSATDLVIKWGRFYIGSQLVTIADLDTEDELEWKTLFSDTTNYIYIDTVNLDFLITNEENNDLFLIWTVFVNAWWEITNIVKEKTFHIWTIGKDWIQWIQWIPWVWIKWDTWAKWAEVEVRNNWTQIQWKYDNEVTWKNLVSIASISWTDWTDWREVEIQKWETHIQYRYVWQWELDWINIVNLNDIKWPAWSIESVWQTVNVNDQQTLDWTVTTDDIEKTITVTNPDWTYTEYKEDWIYYYDVNWDLIFFYPKIWTYTDWVIEFEDWDIVDWINEVIDVTDWNIAYVNKPNIFQEFINRFKWAVIFEWWASFPYKTIDMTWTNIINFNWALAENQKCINLTDVWAKTLNFSNIYQWRTYWLIINNTSDGNISLVAWAVNSNWITTIHSFGTQISTLSFAPWAHFFFMATADTWIHIAYTWLSWPF